MSKIQRLPKETTDDIRFILEGIREVHFSRGESVTINGNEFATFSHYDWTGSWGIVEHLGGEKERVRVEDIEKRSK